VNDELVAELRRLGLFPKGPLGLHLITGDDGSFYLRAHYFIGVWWLKGGKQFVRVRPKSFNGKFVNASKMLLEILTDREVANAPELSQVFKVEPDEPLIKLDGRDEQFLFFLLIYYLRLLSKLVKKGLKKSYGFIEKELTSRTKGKLLVTPTLRRCTLKGLPYRSVCRYPALTADTLENRILKAALVLASQKLRDLRVAETLVRSLNRTFEAVSLTPVSETDFLKLKRARLYPEYEEALKLARLIFYQLGYDPLASSTDSAITAVPPYSINLPLLFELFVWKKLKERYPGLVRRKPPAGQDAPDFVVEGRGIIDAKYKYDAEPDRKDVCQLTRYARNENLRAFFGGEPKLFLVYPSFNAETVKPVKLYHEVYQWHLPVPFVE